ncbi:MAG: sigma-54 dependent transcriptional regulator [Spirochaetia bacterium]|jgi:DNA-binding NtrC family response regulator|uniref:Fused response regulator of ato opeon, in two-component system with AtoS: response regulator sigma54 interaction protein n=2 Tax=root TaxID=1 RepID=A0A652ZV27_9SPIR|nr:sigma-54 dependent transcriptional regulator [Spirochaetia bacterium]MDD3820347.1 sigma-54 dependent transcriptional regulator [Spirochaetales bacterium]NLX45132.1 sigma-54-dependent Fis family transcriptional regulator [Treponema sp.]VBB39527.1 fused response regulator of ato opeon, in two-component system with AtoS: response regulator; sigma54 interaction protein [uncultured Spirochaetota bacterium]MCE1208262.1 sigma-54 dependent transcriptional regulator [Spirochaetia bacterium]
MQSTILIVDDEKNIRDGLAEAFALEGYATLTAQDGQEAQNILDDHYVDLVVTDLKMPKVSGMELLQFIKRRWQNIPVIIITAHGDISEAVAAMQYGALEFITKPLDLDHLLKLTKNALEIRELSIKNQELREEVLAQQRISSIIGKSPAMRKIFDLVRKVAPTKASVLITGESGVGKELIADAIHNLSPRRDKPLIKVHCAALAESLLESELFGHEKGAFTGAQTRKRGRFEMADTGSLFLDEIGEINQNVQIKILRVLQERKFERVGGESTLEVDVRFIAATNKDLKLEIEEGRFREDLYYRLNVVNIHVPPLRERREDIPLLAATFLHEFSQENAKEIEGFETRAKQALFAYDWPGNVRELRNCIESAVVMASGRFIVMEDLPPGPRSTQEKKEIHIPALSSLQEAEKILIAETLAMLGWNKTKTAEVLKIGRKTLYQKIDEYGIAQAAEQA